MSNALERVITEQQERIDLLEAQIKSIQAWSKETYEKSEKFATVVANYQYRALRLLITTPETREKWTEANRELREAIRDFGFCTGCGCFGWCGCDPE